MNFDKQKKTIKLKKGSYKGLQQKRKFFSDKERYRAHQTNSNAK